MADFNLVVFDAAAESGSGDGVERLRAALAAHPDLLDAPNPEERGRTPLHAAARYGSVEAVQLLLDRGSRSLDAPDNKGKTPLHHAAMHGGRNVEAVEALLRAGSQSLDTPDKDGMTPLHHAATERNVRTVETLLRAGADPTIGISDEQRLQFIPAIQRLLVNAPASSEVERLQAQLRAAKEHLASEQVRNRQLQADIDRLQGDNERLVEQLENRVRESHGEQER